MLQEMLASAATPRTRQPKAGHALSRLAALLLSGLKRNSPVLIALLIIGVIGWTGSDVFLTQSNLTNLSQRVAPIALIAIGTTVLMIAGDLDLSIGAAVSVISILVAKAAEAGAGGPMVVAEAMGIGLAMSLMLGTLVTFIRAPAFIVTLGALSVFSGIAFAITNGSAVVLTGFDALGSGKVQSIPISVLILLGANCAFWLLLYRTSVGRSIFAVGGNPDAARLAGFPVQTIRVFCFCLNGLLVGLGAAVLTSNVGSGGPELGTGLELQVIAAVVIGGATLGGGHGSLLGTLLGVLLLGAIANVLNLLGAEPYIGTIVFGAFIILAVALRSERLRPVANWVTSFISARGSEQGALVSGPPSPGSEVGSLDGK